MEEALQQQPLKSGMIAIAGRPNAGKSTLLNRVLGSELSIVTPKAQTTREQVRGILTEERGQIVFIDTPGIHRARKGGINEYMVSAASEALEAPSLVWYLADPRSEIEHEEPVIEAVARSGAPVVLLVSKSDLRKGELPAKREDLTPKLEAELRSRGIDVREVIGISSISGEGIDRLLECSWDILPEGPFLYPDPDVLSDRPVRFFVAEMIREQLYRQLGDELPYSCAVRIDSFRENDTPIRIEASIVVERESQKGMVIGKGGQKIKEIGTAARKKVETFLEAQVFLGLRVEVLPNWTRNAQALKKMGYFLQ